MIKNIQSVMRLRAIKFLNGVLVMLLASSCTTAIYLRRNSLEECHYGLVGLFNDSENMDGSLVVQRNQEEYEIPFLMFLGERKMNGSFVRGLYLVSADAEPLFYPIKNFPFILDSSQYRLSWPTFAGQRYLLTTIVKLPQKDSWKLEVASAMYASSLLAMTLQPITLGYEHLQSDFISHVTKQVRDSYSSLNRWFEDESPDFAKQKMIMDEYRRILKQCSAVPDANFQKLIHDTIAQLSNMSLESKSHVVIEFPAPNVSKGLPAELSKPSSP